MTNVIAPWKFSEDHLELGGWNRKAHFASEVLLKFEINQKSITTCSVFHQKIK